MVFHFNIHNGVPLPDPRGRDLPDFATAKREAIRLAGTIIANQPEDFWIGDEWRLDVVDSAGTTLLSLWLSGAISRAGRALERRERRASAPDQGEHSSAHQ